MLEFIQEHTVEMWALWGVIITLASIIVKLTPNKKDDKVFGGVLKILNALALNPNNNEEKRKREQEEKLEEAKAEVKEELDERNDNTTRDNLVNVLE